MHAEHQWRNTYPAKYATQRFQHLSKQRCRAPPICKHAPSASLGVWSWSCCCICWRFGLYKQASPGTSAVNCPKWFKPSCCKKPRRHRCPKSSRLLCRCHRRPHHRRPHHNRPHHCRLQWPHLIQRLRSKFHRSKWLWRPALPPSKPSRQWPTAPRKPHPPARLHLQPHHAQRHRSVPLPASARPNAKNRNTQAPLAAWKRKAS